MRKHVRPADKAANIPDPERGRDLPPEGLNVTWSTHWAALAARGDVKVKDATDEEPAAETPAAPAAKTDADARSAVARPKPTP